MDPFSLLPIWSSPYPFIALGVVLLAIIALPLLKPKRRAPSYPYVPVSSLFTAHEQRFLGVLEEAAGELRVYGKVRLADIVQVRKGVTASERGGAFNRIAQKHLDFVLCRPSDLAVVCVVELDDSSHQRSDRRARDDFLESALAAARVPLVRVTGSRHYDVTALRAQLQAVTTPPITAPAQDRAA